MIHTLTNLISNKVGASSGGVNALWIWLANEIGPQGASAIQTLVGIVIYGAAAYLVFMQFLRIMHNVHDWNNRDMKKREDARHNVSTGIAAIVITALLVGVGFTMVFYFFGIFMS